MKTLCYKVKYRETNIVNEGFLLVDIDNQNTIINIEGVLTFDYLKANIFPNQIIIMLYERYPENLDEVPYEHILEDTEVPYIMYCKMIIDMETFMLPLNLSFGNYGEDSYCSIETLSKEEPNKYKKRLENFKKNVFIKR